MKEKTKEKQKGKSFWKREGVHNVINLKQKIFILKGLDIFCFF